MRATTATKELSNFHASLEFACSLSCSISPSRDSNRQMTPTRLVASRPPSALSMSIASLSACLSDRGHLRLGNILGGSGVPVSTYGTAPTLLCKHH
ncbi:unnamed protein product [Linum trigynum]|uniref:Uncharacterized protein n=1 Tax=Linum trigynum TaxID=586398 RepID=A0AAV2FVW2_9ROSI